MIDEECTCTCCCLDCIEGTHCGGAVNDHGYCFVPVEPDDDDPPDWWELDDEEWEDEDTDF